MCTCTCPCIRRFFPLTVIVSFTPDREWEEAEWNGDGAPTLRAELEPDDVPGDAAFSLHQLVQTLQ